MFEVLDIDIEQIIRLYNFNPQHQILFHNVCSYFAFRLITKPIPIYNELSLSYIKTLMVKEYFDVFWSKFGNAHVKTTTTTTTKISIIHVYTYYPQVYMFNVSKPGNSRACTQPSNIIIAYFRF